MSTSKSKTTTTPAKKTASKAPGNAGQGASDSMLKEFFVDSLKDIYWAEKALVKTLPKMESAATSSDLKNAFIDHLEVTKAQVSSVWPAG